MPGLVAKLIDQARQGDRVALGRLLILHDERLRRHLANRVGATLAVDLTPDDILQETYTEAYRHIQGFDPRGPRSFYQWLATIADRKVTDGVRRLRAQKRSPRPGAKRIATDRSTSLLGLVGLVDPRGKTPSGVVARREAVRAVQAALASLPEPCRQALWMRYIEGKAISEIAAALGRSPGAVHQLCHRGLQRLREQMGNRSAFLSD